MRLRRPPRHSFGCPHTQGSWQVVRAGHVCCTMFLGSVEPRVARELRRRAARRGRLQPDQGGTRMDKERTPDAPRRMPTGIPGFDDIACGGLPLRGVTVVLGGAGAGKTIFAVQVLSTAARERGEAGILVAF